ncbi:MAG: hypothetical protein CMB37_06655 [Euryarchaeota archaeon]|nr:hypothetical protein [Euryarchaeota archaeon]
MPMVIDPVAEIECSAVVQGIDVSPDGTWLAWGGEDGEIRIIDLTEQPKQLEPFNVEDSVTKIRIAHGNMIVIGTHTGDIHGHERLGGHRWSQSIGGGCDHLEMSGDGTIIGCIDGARNLHIYSENGLLRGKFSSGELVLLAIARDGTGLAVADDSGNVRVLDSNGNLRWSRLAESEDGETISAMCFMHDGSLILCREVLGITPSEIPQIAIERWSSIGERTHSEEIDSRCVRLIPDRMGAICGHFDGTVMMLDSELNQEVMWKSMYSISDIRRHGEDILVASWFYLYRISPSEGEVWRCEHTGLVERIVANSDGSRIVISGDNQNDYTRENRIFWINPDSTPYALSSESEIDDDLLAFTEGSELKPPVAGADDDIYANDGDIAGLLTAEEQEMLSKAPTKFDDSELFDMLDDEIEKMANFEDEDEADILADLSDDGFVTHIPPTADAGSDQVMGASDDGTAIVILDGTATTAGSQNIEQWSWRDGDSKQIGKTPKIKVRLPIGNYTFTLTVTDSGRESSTDTITVQIQGDVTDDSFSLLED